MDTLLAIFFVAESPKRSRVAPKTPKVDVGRFGWIHFSIPGPSLRHVVARFDGPSVSPYQINQALLPHIMQRIYGMLCIRTKNNEVVPLNLFLTGT